MEIDLNKPADNALPFLVERANAIERYAQVEQALSLLFSDLLGTTFDLGGIVFFRVTNASARNAIIESLLEKRHGTTYEAYWHGIPNTPHKRGLFTLLRQLDQRRNEIVHWHGVTNIHAEGDKATSTLTNAWTYATDTQSIAVDDMREFSAKADFVARSAGMFMVFASNRFDNPDWRQTWHGIFQQPCTYPPAEGHPLSQKPPAP